MTDPKPHLLRQLGERRIRRYASHEHSTKSVRSPFHGASADHLAEALGLSAALIAQMEAPAVPVATIRPVDFDQASNPLRPATLDAMIGQTKLKPLLRRLVDSAHASGRPLDHLLLVGASGTGKSTTAIVVARELGQRVFSLKAPVDMGTLEALREEAQDGDVVFVDEALALSTAIPTPTGWTTIGRLRVGDEIFGAAGETTRVVDLKPIHTPAQRYLVDFRDGTSLVTDAGHKWLAALRISGGSTYLKPRIVSTREMMDSGRSWRIPNPKPVELPEADLPMSPYLLGHWLGNGSLGQCYLHVRPEMAEATLGRAREEFPAARYLAKRVSNGSLMRLSLSPDGVGGWRGSGWGQGRHILEATGAFTNKHIPAAYLRGSVAQRLDFLRGLMDTEGYVNPVSGMAVFSNTNHSIVSGVAELLRSLGYMPSVRFAGDAAGVQCFKVSFRPTPDRNPFLFRDAHLVRDRLHGDQRRIVGITPVAPGPVRCIEVDAPDHLFLAGEGMVPTHNCHMQISGDRRGITQACDPESFYMLLEDGILATPRGPQPFPHVTWIGATTDVGLLPEPLSNRFPLQPRLAPYSEEEMTQIAAMNASALGLELDAGVAEVFGGACRLNPRQCNSYMRAAKSLSADFTVGRELATEVIVDLASTTLDGLTDSMQTVLKFLYQRCQRTTKGEVIYSASVNTLATACGHGRDTKAVSLLVEPWLLQRGLLEVRPSGRTLTDAGVARAKELLA